MDLKSLAASEKSGFAVSVAGTAAVTALLAPFQRDVGLLNVGLLFVLLTLLVSSTWGRRTGFAAAVLTNLSLNFFFVEPLHEFAVRDFQNVLALLIFLAVSVIGSSLLAAARQSEAQAKRRQAQTEVLFRLSSAMVGQTDPQAALQAVCDEVVVTFAAPGASVLQSANRDWNVLAHAGSAEAARSPATEERALADRAVADGRYQAIGVTGLAGKQRKRIVGFQRPKREGYPSVVAMVPLTIGENTFGVLRLDGPLGETLFHDTPQQLLQAFAAEAAVAIQRVELGQAAARSEIFKRADEMKTSLITSISHDLKTPLASIKTSVSGLMDASVDWAEDDRRAFLNTIETETDRLNDLISDILDLNRIESGAVRPVMRPHSAEDLLRVAQELTTLTTAGHPLSVDAAPDIFAMADERLIVQALVNLIENAAKYSSPGQPIRLTANRRGSCAELGVENEGPAIAVEDVRHVFERFYRSEHHRRQVSGSGLGLAIVKGFVTLCGGTVDVESSGQHTRFVIRLQLAGSSSRVA